MKGKFTRYVIIIIIIIIIIFRMLQYARLNV